ncbi:MAG: hypothetical protein Q4Q03_05940 [Bowdeniella nasicola]|nr:hypothetical protein [Bowdeniella nasicola]
MAPNFGPRKDPGPIPPLQRKSVRDASLAGSDDQPDPAEENAPAESEQPDETAGGQTPRRIAAAHRKAPRYGRFIFTGLLLGACVSFLIAIVTRTWSGLTMANTFWLSLLGLGALGMFLGAVIALYLDRKSLAALERQLED